MVDPNTGFEFNLQLLASENGYQTLANGKNFLVRRTPECRPSRLFDNVPSLAFSH